MNYSRDFSCEGERLRVQLQTVDGKDACYRIQIGDRVHEVEARLLPDGRVRFTLGGEVFVADSGSAGKSLHVRVADQTWLLAPFEGRPSTTAAQGSGIVEAPMTGKVEEILVSVGQAVELGETLAVLTAMKMEHKLPAGIAGKVAEINVETGDTVDQGTVILRVEADEANKQA